MKLIHAIAVLGMATTLAACEKEIILQGERLDPRDVLSGDVAAAATPAKETALALPAQVSNADWAQRAGGADHALVYAAIGAGTSLQWSAAIGQGADRRHRITATPVVHDGRIFTLDSRARVTATGTNGQTLWQSDLTPASDNPDDASGGGLAAADGKVFVTTGFAELIALDAASGAVIWRQKFGTVVGGAPTVADGMVYVVARDSSSWALRVSDGKVIWQLDAAPGPSAMTGASAPAVGRKSVIFPYAGGQLIAALKKGGQQLWQSSVPGLRPGRSYALVRDVTGDPVVVGSTIYAATSAGKISAIDLNSGERKWTATQGATAPVQVAGGSVFLVSDEAQLVRLDARTGTEIWSVDLPYYLKDKIKKQQEIHAHLGPVLAGGKLFVASSDDRLRVFDPKTGALLSEAVLPGGAATSPVVAGSTLYVPSNDGKLLAFR